MFEKFFKKQEKVQENVQKQQELNDDKGRELTDEELDMIRGGTCQCEPSDVTEDAIINLPTLDETPFS